MENKDHKDKDIVNKFLDEINTYFEKNKQESPCETLPNSMTTTHKHYSILWRPNNYRRQLTIKPLDNSTIDKLKSAIPLLFPGCGFNQNSHTRLINIHHKNITIQIGKKTITGIYSQNIINGIKETYHIQRPSIDDIGKFLSCKVDEIGKLIDNGIMLIVNAIDCHIPNNTIIWSRYEDWIKGEEYIDKLPREVIIHDTYFKKVYGTGIEFKQSELKEAPGVHMKQYIKNRAIEDIAPEINDELNILKQSIASVETKLTPVLDQLTEQIRLHLAVQKDTQEFLKQANNNLEIINKHKKQANKIRQSWYNSLG